MPGSPAHAILFGDVILNLIIPLGSMGHFNSANQSVDLSHIINEKQLWQEAKVTYVGWRDQIGHDYLGAVCAIGLPPKFLPSHHTIFMAV